MAEVLFKQLVEAKGQSADWRIESAGTAAVPGDPAMDNSQIVASERGLDLSEHRSQPTHPIVVEGFGLLLVMEERHKRLLQQFPQLADRVFTLREMVDQAGDIHDPVGMGLPEYRDMADEVGAILEAGFDRIEELADESHLKERND